MDWLHNISVIITGKTFSRRGSGFNFVYSICVYPTNSWQFHVTEIFCEPGVGAKLPREPISGPDMSPGVIAISYEFANTETRVLLNNAVIIKNHLIYFYLQWLDWYGSLKMWKPHIDEIARISRHSLRDEFGVCRLGRGSWDLISSIDYWDYFPHLSISF